MRPGGHHDASPRLSRGGSIPRYSLAGLASNGAGRSGRKSKINSLFSDSTDSVTLAGELAGELLSLIECVFDKTAESLFSLTETLSSKP